VRLLREQLGFTVVGAWTIEEENRFVWILSWNGAGSLHDADRAYYESPERAALASFAIRWRANIRGSTEVGTESS
jgi:hypothetical protein